jgi:predicted ATPase/DNA-binding SARP family transcriptional activator
VAGGNLEFGILGPLEAWRDGEPIALGAAKQRALLARLLLQPDEVVPVDKLIEDVWGDKAPPTASQSVQLYVSNLRKVLGRETIRREGRGYAVAVRKEQVDAGRFAALLERARTEAPAHASATLRDALGLWRGPALVDFRYESFAQAAIAALEEERLAAVEARIGANLASGAGSELVPELQSLVAEHPLRERLRAQLMLALYRAGRQADALAAYQDARQTLLDELGIDPSPDLQELYRAILNQDESLRVAAAERPTSNLPTPPNELVGRAREVDEVVRSLRSSRLVTITGPGGSGKTRLALAAAADLGEECPDGVWLVSLAAIRDPELVEPTIATVLEANDELDAHLRPKELLLLLDNVEQLLPEVAHLIARLLDAPGVRVLATSRERLAVFAEQEYPVPVLPVEPAVELFVQRARRLKPSFDPDENVAAIVTRLDGLPLAIELAAARVKVLTPGQIRERLARSLELLTLAARDAPARQRTLRTTMEWSYELLSERERGVFARLAVFAGSFDAVAAAVIAEADVDALQALVDKSLLRSTGDGRFVSLETIHEFAFEQLSSDETEAAETRERHATHFLAVAEHIEVESRAGGEADPYHQLDRNLANLRAAIDWAREVGRSDLLVRYATALARFWCARGYVREGRALMDEVLATVADPPAQALLGRCALRLLAGAGAHELMAEAEAALAVCEESGDDFSRAQAWNLMARLRGVVLAQLGAAERACEQALFFAERGNFKNEKAEAIWGLTLAALSGPMPVPAAIARADELLTLAADEPETRAFCLSARGALEAMAGNFELGRAQLAEGTAIFERLGLNVFAANNAQLSFVVEMLAGDPDAAARALRASFERLTEMGEQGFLSTIAAYLAHVLYDLRQDSEAERLSHVSAEKAAPDDIYSQILWRGARAKVLARRFELDRAHALASEAVELAQETDLLNTQGDTLLDLAHVLSLADRRGEASAAVDEAVRRFSAKGNTAAVARATKAAAETPALVD